VALNGTPPPYVFFLFAKRGVLELDFSFLFSPSFFPSSLH